MLASYSKHESSHTKELSDPKHQVIVLRLRNPGTEGQEASVLVSISASSSEFNFGKVASSL